MDRSEFWRHYEDWQKGKISRRRFMQVTGLGVASAIVAACAPQSGSSPAASAVAPAPTAGAAIDPTADWNDFASAMNANQQRVLLGMSGGVDSSVAGYLLRLGAPRSSVRI